MSSFCSGVSRLPQVGMPLPGRPFVTVSQKALWSMLPSGPTECLSAGAKLEPTASSPWQRVQ